MCFISKAGIYLFLIDRKDVKRNYSIAEVEVMKSKQVSFPQSANSSTQLFEKTNSAKLNKLKLDKLPPTRDVYRKRRNSNWRKTQIGTVILSC